MASIVMVSDYIINYNMPGQTLALSLLCDDVLYGCATNYTTTNMWPDI